MGGRARGDLVEFPRQRADAIGGMCGTITVSAPTARVPRNAASACSPNGRACTLQTARPAASRSARRPSGSEITSNGSTAP